MTMPDYAHLILILDESGSMDVLTKAVVTSIDGLITEQRGLPGKCTLSVYTFSKDTGEPVRTGMCLADIHTAVFNLDAYHPHGLTPLYDAVLYAIKREGEALDALTVDTRPSKIMVAIFTDGYENASKSSLADVQAQIKLQTDIYSWEFIFLGANIDAGAVGGDMGVGASISYDATSVGYANVMRQVSHRYTTMRSHD